MKKVIAVIITLNLGFCFAQSRSVQAASRKTAERCLKLAENYLLDGDYNSAVSQAEMGLAYDDTISDLYFIKASGLKSLNATVSEVMKLSREAYERGNWIGYNEKVNRILLADLFSDTGNFEAALNILDTKPFLFSSDAEAIRIKTYYRMGSEESVAQARAKINSARRIYKEDLRFHNMFYSFEIARVFDGKEVDPVAAEMAAVFSSELRAMKKNNRALNITNELECLSIFFEDGEQLLRDAKAFHADGKKNLLFPIIALKAGYLSQADLVSLFIEYAGDTIPVEMLGYFAQRLTDEDALLLMKDFLRSFNGHLLCDTDDDLQWEIRVDYENGRPCFVYYDENEDGLEDFSAELDYGEVIKAVFNSGKKSLSYETYPYVSNAEETFPINSGEEKIVYEFAKNTMVHELFDFTCPESLQYDEENKFYFPLLKDGWNKEDLHFYENAAFIKLNTCERENAWITFALLEGKIVSGVFAENNVAYAALDFVDGVPAVRNVDYNNDGIFETIEYFSSYTEENRNSFSQQDKDSVEKIFGNGFFGFEYSNLVYISRIEIDYNGDTIPDFTEEYQEDGGKRVMWDLDNDREPERMFIRYPKKGDEPVVEEAVFVSGISCDVVSVFTEDGIPSSVKFNGDDFAVLKGKNDKFFWIKNEDSVDAENFFLREMSRQENGNLVSFTFDNDDYFVVKVADVIYAKKIDRIYLNEDEVEEILETEEEDSVNEL